MPITPCSLCGYDAPGSECPHCRREPADPALARTAGMIRGPFETAVDGLRALPAGLVLLRRTPRVIRLLVPPVLLTAAVLLLAFVWLHGAIDAAFDAAANHAGQSAGSGEGWLAAAVRWTLENPALGFVAGLGRWVFFLAAAYLLAVWSFSLVYEAIAGPFLDEIQGRIEARWFERDPREELDRPTGHSVRACVTRTAIAGAAGLALALAGLVVDGELVRPLLLASPAPLVLLTLLDREYRRWLLWVVRSESAALWISLEAAAFAGVLMLLFLWVKFIPLVGVPIFLGIAGFATAISLLDIPLSRRRWSLGQRLRFVGHHIVPVTTFGLTASATFVLLPLVGLLVTVPLASIGGLWLVCRLDKSFLRS